MKSNKGITLTALVVYVICLVFITGLISSLTSYFYRNSNEVISKNNSHEQYTKFLTYILKDLNSDDLSSYDIDNSVNNTLIFSFKSGKEHRYVLKNHKLYYENLDPNNLKEIILCEKVSADESYPFDSDGQLIINVTINGEKFSNRLTAGN